MSETVRKDAVISPCGTYRYRLTREWDESKPTVAFVMLNPSTADAEVDDPTIRRVIGFARSWGFGRVWVYNLFALRSTDPDHILRHPDPVGPENDAHLQAIPADIPVVAAWGMHHRGHLGRAFHVGRMLKGRLECLGRTNGGHPRHPLYVRGDAQRSRFG